VIYIIWGIYNIYHHSTCWQATGAKLLQPLKLFLSRHQVSRSCNQSYYTTTPDCQHWASSSSQILAASTNTTAAASHRKPHRINVTRNTSNRARRSQQSSTPIPCSPTSRPVSQKYILLPSYQTSSYHWAALPENPSSHRLRLPCHILRPRS